MRNYQLPRAVDRRARLKLARQSLSLHLIIYIYISDIYRLLRQIIQMYSVLGGQYRMLCIMVCLFKVWPYMRCMKLLSYRSINLDLWCYKIWARRLSERLASFNYLFLWGNFKGALLISNTKRDVIGSRLPSHTDNFRVAFINIKAI